MDPGLSGTLDFAKANIKPELIVSELFLEFIIAKLEEKTALGS
jgi:hypothetical protein